MKINRTDNNIKNLILDLGVVLIDLTPCHCLKAFNKYGVKNIEDLLDPQYKHGVFLEFEAGNISANEFRNKLRELSGIAMTDQQIDNAWNSFLGEIPVYKLDFLKELKESFNLILLSNTNSIHWNWITSKYNSSHHLFEEYFNKIYLSYDLHLVKPDQKIFEYLLKDSGLIPEETFFIDDAYENCCSAGAFGIQSYTPQPQEDWSHLFK